MLLYRYLDFDGGLKTLKDCALKATRPIDFNDPFEYLLKVETDRRLFRKEFLPALPKEVIKQRVKDTLRSDGVTNPFGPEDQPRGSLSSWGS